MSFTYRGTTSDSMFFNVTERQVYNAPAFDVNAIEVPGRSGDVLNSQQRFKNKTLVYTGFIRSSDFPGNTQWERLSRGLRNIKAWICGDAGKYHDLTDDYDPGFIRRAFVSGETAINILFDRPDGATITITFMAEPFMYEVSEPMELPETKSASGDIITITDGADNTPLKSAVVNIEPVQDLHGYDSPWPGGGGKNLYDASIITGQGPAGNNGVVCTVSNGVINLNGTATSNAYFSVNGLHLPSGNYAISANNPSGTNGVHIALRDENGNYYSDLGLSQVNCEILVSSRDLNSVIIYVIRGTQLTNFKLQPQVEVGTAATSWSPYSNICPISGWSQVNVWVKPTYDTSLTPTATIPLGRTVYGGTLDVLAGKMAINKNYIEMNGTETWNDAAISPASAALGLKRYWALFNSTSYPAVINSPTLSNQLKTYTTDSWNVKTAASLRVEVQGRYEVAVYSSDFPDATAWKNYLTTHPLQAVYELATPIEVDLTPQTIKTLLGVNNIWANTGETEVEYIVPTENPTQWPSQPRLEITMSGAGTLTVNGKTWSIGSYTGTLICDSEIMDWYDAGALKNSLVSGDGFPELAPGDNVITYTGGITKVVATPRWRTL